MSLRKWDKLPQELRTPAVLEYYEILTKKKFSLFIKRVFDIFASLIMLILLSPLFLILAVAIKIDSKGPVFYKQERITRYGKKFKIFKFRTMINNAQQQGPNVTVKDDCRITKVGKVIRKCRLDEISQLLNIIAGQMTFVGTRPEIEKYVEKYSQEMKATLLMPAGLTSLASIYFKDEQLLLGQTEDVDKTYIEKILPEKMKYNLLSIKKFGFFKDIKIMFMTVFAVFGKKYTPPKV